MDFTSTFGLIYWINLILPVVVIASAITVTISLMRIASNLYSVARSLEEIKQSVKRGNTL